MSMQADETRTAKLLSPDREQKLGPEKCLSVPSWKTIFWVVFVLFIITIVILLIIGINSEIQGSKVKPSCSGLEKEREECNSFCLAEGSHMACGRCTEFHCKCAMKLHQQKPPDDVPRNITNDLTKYRSKP